MIKTRLAKKNAWISLASVLILIFLGAFLFGEGITGLSVGSFSLGLPVEIENSTSNEINEVIEAPAIQEPLNDSEETLPLIEETPSDAEETILDDEESTHIETPVILPPSKEIVDAEEIIPIIEEVASPETIETINNTPIDNISEDTSTGSLDTMGIINIMAAPVVSNVVINSTLGTNWTTENLTVHWDATSNTTKNITNWKLNSTSITLVNMPFENVSDSVYNATKDYSGFNNNGSESAGVFWNSTGGYDGKGAFEFDGVDDHIIIPSVAIDNKFTVLAWVKSNLSACEAGTGCRILENGYDSHFYLGTSIDDGAGFKFVVNNGDDPYGAAEGGTISPGTWQMVAGTFDGTTGILYVDGVEIARDTFDDPGSVTDDIYVGRYPGAATAHWNGTIDDIRIFNRTLTPNQIKAIYHNRTDVLSFNETSPEDIWTACITPNDGEQDGTEVCSGDLTVKAICGNAIETNTTLTENITCSGTALIIGADDITLDCAGYTINYSTATETVGYGINNTAGHNRTTIKNCNIVEGNTTTNSKYGIYFLGGENGTIENTNVTTIGTSAYGIYFDSAPNSTLTNNTINTTGSSGYGAYLLSSSNSTLTGNTVITSASTGYGIYLWLSSSSNMTDNTITTNGSNGYGIYFRASPNSSVVGNTITTNGSNGFGIRCFTTSNSSMSSNAINTTGSSGYSIYIDENSNFNTATNNTLFASGDDAYGVYIYESASSILTNNTMVASGTDGYGVYILYDDTYPTNNNILLNNNISSTNSNEIYDESGVTNTNYLIYNNTYGQINWSKTNLTTNITLEVGNTIFLENNTVGLTDNSEALNLNSSAEIEISGVSYDLTPWLMKDGVRCDDTSLCNITYDSTAGILYANVSSFSNYTTQDVCGSSITSNTTLTENITCSGTALIIGADDITLDCAGYTINYSTAGTLGYGINNTAGHNRTTIKNCNLMESVTATNFKYAIYFLGAENGTIENNTFTTVGGGSAAIFFDSSSNSNITNNTMITSGGNGFGIDLDTSSNITATGNTINTSGTASATIILEAISESNTFTNNVLVTTGPTSGYGVYASQAPNLNVINNTMDIGGDSGIGIYTIYGLDSLFLSNSSIINNTITTNGSEMYGIYAACANINITDNVITTGGSDSYGIGSQSPELDLIRNSVTTTGSDSHGIILCAASNINLTNNTITTSGSGAYGVALSIWGDTTSHDNVLLNNNISSGQTYEIFDDTGDTRTNYLIYNNTYGEIRWTDTTNGGFLKNLTLNGSIGLGNNLFIGNNTAALNTSAFATTPNINSSANITLSGLSHSRVVGIQRLETYSIDSSEIIDDGTNCNGTSCEILSYSNSTGILSFNTTQFSSFAGNENTAPNTVQVVINASSINNYTGDDLICYANITDVDGDSVYANYTWYNNSVAHLTGQSTAFTQGTLFNIANLTSDNTTEGQNWTCEVWAYDGIVYESDTTNSSLVVLETPSEEEEGGPVVMTPPSGEEPAEEPAEEVSEEEEAPPVEEIETDVEVIVAPTEEGADDSISTIDFSFTNDGENTIRGETTIEEITTRKLAEEERFRDILREKGLTEEEIEERIELERLKEQENLMSIMTTKFFSLGIKSGINYSDEFVSGRLLRSEILNPGELVVEPGETIEKTLEVRKGISARPKSVKVAFKSLGETIVEKEVAFETPTIGTAIDVDTGKKVMDLYMVIPSIDENSEEGEDYLLELNVNRNPEEKTAFADLYGPFKVKHKDAFVFAQQLKYDPEDYYGEYLVKTKILLKGEVVAENGFEVHLGEKVSPEISDHKIVKKISVALATILIVLAVILLCMFAGFYVHRKRKSIASSFEELGERLHLFKKNTKHIVRKQRRRTERNLEKLTVGITETAKDTRRGTKYWLISLFRKVSRSIINFFEELGERLHLFKKNTKHLVRKQQRRTERNLEKLTIGITETAKDTHRGTKYWLISLFRKVITLSVAVGKVTIYPFRITNRVLKKIYRKVRFVVLALVLGLGMILVKLGRVIKSVFISVMAGSSKVIKTLVKGITITLKALKVGMWIIFTKLVSVLDAIYSRPIRAVLKIKAFLEEKKSECKEKESRSRKRDRSEAIQERRWIAGELKRFIEVNIAQGVSKEKIKEILIENGWPQKIVEDYVKISKKRVEKKKGLGRELDRIEKELMKLDTEGIKVKPRIYQREEPIPKSKVHLPKKRAKKKTIEIWVESEKGKRWEKELRKKLEYIDSELEKTKQDPNYLARKVYGNKVSTIRKKEPTIAKTRRVKNRREDQKEQGKKLKRKQLLEKKLNYVEEELMKLTTEGISIKRERIERKKPVLQTKTRRKEFKARVESKKEQKWRAKLRKEWEDVNDELTMLERL